MKLMSPRNYKPRLIRTMIVDDSTLIPKILALCLRTEMVEIVAVAKDAEEALRKIAQSEPDLIISDVRLPKTNGIDLAVTVRKAHKETRVILISIDKLRGDEAVKARVADAFVSKAELVRTLPSKIRECLPERFRVVGAPAD